MPAITFITPLDQPTGNLRLFNLLRASFQDPAYSSFLCAVAFAKSGPLLRLYNDNVISCSDFDKCSIIMMISTIDFLIHTFAHSLGQKWTRSLCPRTA